MLKITKDSFAKLPSFDQIEYYRILPFGDNIYYYPARYHRIGDTVVQCHIGPSIFSDKCILCDLYAMPYKANGISTSEFKAYNRYYYNVIWFENSKIANLKIINIGARVQEIILKEAANYPIYDIEKGRNFSVKTELNQIQPFRNQKFVDYNLQFFEPSSIREITDKIDDIYDLEQLENIISEDKIKYILEDHFRYDPFNKTSKYRSIDSDWEP